jgi:hypothetical protein
MFCQADSSKDTLPTKQMGNILKYSFYLPYVLMRRNDRFLVDFHERNQIVMI